jgi:hypothetical protein
MHRLSIVQALSLWQSLEDAYRKEHNYGGDVAEIYVYRLMPRCPLAEAYVGGGQKAPPSTLTGEEGRKAIRDANESFHNLLAHFAKERNAIIEVEEYKDGKWVFSEFGEFLKTFNEGHRWHVRVRPRAR